MVEIKTSAEVEAMRGAGQVVAEILAAVQDQAKAGMRTAELDEVARDVLARNGAYSPFLNYQPGFAPVPFPATICTSVNDAALHGIPGRYKLADGDLLSVDCGAVLDGWTGDAAVSFTIGTPRPADKRLIDVTRDALRAGIAAAVPGARIGDISAAIGAVGRAGGYGICTDFGGHGVGRSMHEDPSVPNEGPAGPRPQDRPRAGHRHRALVPGRRPGHVPDRPRRLDDPQRRRQPGRARRAHGGRHRGRPAGPDRPRP